MSFLCGPTPTTLVFKAVARGGVTITREMQTNASCEECEAIRRELTDAYSEAWNSSDQPSKDAWTAVMRMIGGTEDDAKRAEALAPLARFPNPHRIERALQRKFYHEAFAGHKVGPVPEE